jgi:hypothetical protein
MLEEHLLPKADQLDRIARESRLIQRSSPKFNAAGFLVALLKAVIKGDTSLNHLVMHLAGFAPKPMTRQGIFQRFGPASSAFLLGVIRHVLSQRYPETIAALRASPFRRVIVEDSTVVSMAKSNAANFPNNGNRHEMTAGCKCLLIADLLSGKPLDFQLHAAREADQSLAFEAVDLCRKDDLILRDMGFFCLAALAEIGHRNAFWISRLPASVSAADIDGKALARILAGSAGDLIDIPVVIGRGTLPCRLIAIRLDRERASANRRHIRSESKRRGRSTPKKESLVRAGWRILVTNLSVDQMAADRISDLYALRWSIEIKFRAFKQSCKLSHGLKHKSGFHHIEAMVLAAMLYQLLTMRVHAALVRRRAFAGWLSIEKISDYVSIYLLGLARDLSTSLPPPDPRHLRYEKRKRMNHWQSITHSLA